MPQDHAGKGVQVGLLLLPVAFLAGPLAAVYGDADILAFVCGHPVPLAVAVLASLGIGVVLASLKREELHGYWAMLIATAVLLPSAMVLITTVVYLAGVPALTALLWGALTAAEVWLVAALMFRTFAEAQHGIPSSYGELRQRLDQLKATLDVTCATSAASDPHATLACSEATTQTKKIEDDLKQRGSLGAGPRIRQRLGTAAPCGRSADRRGPQGIGPGRSPVRRPPAAELQNGQLPGIDR
jgi:hypothetical protein